MIHNTPGPGLVSEFQVSSNPWVTSSLNSGIVEYSFPYLTKSFVVRNSSGASSINVGFTQNGLTTTSNYFSLAAGESFSADFRLKSLFVSGSGNTVSIIAGLTGIKSSQLSVITSSNGWPGVG